MCEPVIAYKASNGSLHPTCEKAEEYSRYLELEQCAKDLYPDDYMDIYRRTTLLFHIASKYYICKVNP